MKILAFDTSANACSVAVALNSKELFLKTEEMQRGQAENLIPFIEQAMTASELEFNDLDFIAVTIGPGSFTGLRVAISTAKALGLVSGVEVLGVPSTMAVAYEVFEKNINLPILVIQETKREDFYLQLFSKDFEVVSEPEAGTKEYILNKLKILGYEKLLLCGDGSERFLSELSEKIGLFEKVETKFINPLTIASIAEKQAKGVIKKYKAEPIYVKPPEIRR